MLEFAEAERLETRRLKRLGFDLIDFRQGFVRCLSCNEVAMILCPSEADEGEEEAEQGFYECPNCGHKGDSSAQADIGLDD